jgi:mannitol-1-phosphate 5-dehydrogenase
MPTTGILFCSVFGNNLEDLAKDLAAGLEKRWMANPDPALNMITCENFTDAAAFLKKKVLSYLEDAAREWLEKKVGFSESMVLRTCLGPDQNQDPLAIRAQNFFKLPCDREAIKGEIPDIHGLRPLVKFRNQLRRKIYTYNCINAVITYLAAEKGYHYLWEGGTDPEITTVARQAAVESSDAQIAEYGFNRKEQYEWVEAALYKFADQHLPDPISRNGADPVRKLQRDDRLVGPALLAMKHNIHPEGLIKGIFAAFKFNDKNRNIKISDQISEEGIEAVLQRVCGLSPGEALYELLRKEFREKSR